MNTAMESVSRIYSSARPHVPLDLYKPTTIAKITLVAIALILIFDAWPAHMCGVGIITSVVSFNSLFFFSIALILTNKKTILPATTPTKRTEVFNEEGLTLLGPSDSSNLLSLEKNGFSFTDCDSFLESNIPIFGYDDAWDQDGTIVQPEETWGNITRESYNFPVDIEKEIKLLRSYVDDPDPSKIKNSLLRVCALGTEEQKTEAEEIVASVQQWYIDNLLSVQRDIEDYENEEAALKNRVGLIGQEVVGELLSDQADSETPWSTIVALRCTDGRMRYGLLHESSDEDGVGKCIVGTAPLTEKTVPLNTIYTFDDLNAQADPDPLLWEKLQEYLFELLETIAQRKRSLTQITQEKALVDCFPALFNEVKGWNVSDEENLFFTDPFPIIWGVRSFSQKMRFGLDISFVYTEPEKVELLQQWFDRKGCFVKVKEMRDCTPLLNHDSTETFFHNSRDERSG